MPKLRRLSGVEVIAILKRFGFEIYSQRGSHVKLRRVSNDTSLGFAKRTFIETYAR
ncbi:MAG TPA: type II toxin-antitoxin system HicA family toxin [Xenococcaceae cyanobacterium]